MYAIPSLKIETLVVFAGSTQLIPDSEADTQTSVCLRLACFTKRVLGLHSENLASKREGPWKIKLITEIKNTKWIKIKTRALGPGGSSQVKLDREQLRDIPKPERKLGLFRFEAGSPAAQIDLKVDTELKMTSNF